MEQTKKSVPAALLSAADEINVLVTNAHEALESFYDFDQAMIDHIVAKVSVEALDAHGSLAKLAVDETKRGVFEDKATKNLFAVEYVINHMRHLKTVGVISEDDVKGITEIADPVGVVCGITPVTNPTATTIFKSLIALKTRNPIIFAFHPNAQQSVWQQPKFVMKLQSLQVHQNTAFSGLKNQQWKKQT